MELMRITFLNYLFFFFIPPVKTWISFLGPTNTKPSASFPTRVIGLPHFKTVDNVIRGHSSIMIVKIIKGLTLSQSWVARSLNGIPKKGKKSRFYTWEKDTVIKISGSFFLLNHIPSPCNLWHNAPTPRVNFDDFWLGVTMIVTTFTCFFKSAWFTTVRMRKFHYDHWREKRIWMPAEGSHSYRECPFEKKKNWTISHGIHQYSPP
jgi:hypothetical protein